MEINLSSSENWILLGFVAILFEMLFLSGFGILFAGFGALTTAAAISLYPHTISYQFPIFAISSFIWLGMLWKPLKKYLYHKSVNSNVASDLVGQNVEVIQSALHPGGSIGYVRWSGTILSARLGSTVLRPQAVGTVLKIKEVVGSLVICE